MLLSKQRISTSLVLALLIALTSGCASSNSSRKADEQNPFADYPVADILDAGDKALDAGETERAVYIYMQALEIEQSAETWYRIGVGKARLGDKGYARKAFEKAIELNPDHVGAHEELGMTYMAMAQPEQAKPHLQKATELDPARWRAWNALGVLADMDKQYATAVEFYHSGLIAAPQSPILMTNIGYSYYLAGDMEQAASWFGRALVAEDNYPPAVKNLALLYARRGWYDEAVQTFSKVVPKPQAYNDVGYVAMRDGNYEAAYELLTEAVRLSPTYYKKAYENLEIVKKQLTNEGKASPAEAALNATSSNRIVVVDGQGPRKATVTAELLNVRSEPESDADIVTHLQAGDNVEVIMTKPGWAFVNYRPSANDDSLTGWVNSRYVGSAEQVSTLAAEPASGSKETANVAESTEQAAGEKVADKKVGSPEPTAAIELGSAELPEAAITYAVATESDVTAAELAELPDAAVQSDAEVEGVAAGADTSNNETANSAVISPDEIESDGAMLPAAMELQQAPVQQVAPAGTDNPVVNERPMANLADAVTQKVGGVCAPGTQAEKTPQGAGSCIGVASLSADD